MNFKILFAILALSAAGYAAGKSLSPAEALSRVVSSDIRKAKNASAAPTLLATSYDKTGNPAIFVYTYSGAEGFMLVSADDAVAPLLGYSETNSFILDDMPENLASWMSLYTDQIEAARDLAPYVAVGTRANEMAAIRPLLKTTWDQGSPFNAECPKVGNRLCVTGCVATAMAQVMKYWEYPLEGKGSIAYKPEMLDEELTLDFSTITFDWENMLDVYGKSYSTVERKAVATLMKACGYSVKMNYTPGESGAYSKDIVPALVNYFGYDRGVALKDRSGYASQDAWNAMIYNELKTAGPVIYNGRSSSGAHCFVCDGYDGNGYFHINWGWGGLSDGYFLLNELTPKEVGTGGHYGGYNLSQSAVVGIMPPVGRLTVEDISIDNAAADSGNVKGWGYTYRINDFSNILLSVDLIISGGHISAPLYYAVYDYDPDTKKNKELVLESEFDKPLNASDGKVTCSTYVHLNNYDPGKLYNLVVSYDLKGQRNTIGSVRLAASAGVEDVVLTQDVISLRHEGNVLIAEGDTPVNLQLYDLSGSSVASVSGVSPRIVLSGMAGGVYIAVAKSAEGRMKTLKLHLK